MATLRIGRACCGSRLGVWAAGIPEGHKCRDYANQVEESGDEVSVALGEVKRGDRDPEKASTSHIHGGHPRVSLIGIVS
jgi:hypothetical protein